MSAYKDALHINSDESGSRLALAEAILANEEGVVVLDGVLALRPSGPAILCEVIPQGSRSASGHVAEIASAQALLERSTLSQFVAGHALQWLAVEDYGTGTLEVWRAS